MAMQMHSQTGETCLICGQVKQTGIHICNQLICDSCQEKIVKTDVTDWKYKHYVNKLSQLRLKTMKQTEQTK
ncbi:MULTISPECIES: sigma factor G inhibitor Gin [unclassified Sporolactobacillus]|uniref:sigma factor G inhibitor Gin n=1 Tax=unclassified Sporolactobacillus TaxID=2628533 RepID=UPI002368EB0B|nr:sigma factor G inhibitor Gin [Sporolactobacillus sp. CQH2019]MDD9150670.1 sigma factor G inhibitor Gin [Sporolactobacillus sp. CQH2019]